MAEEVHRTKDGTRAIVRTPSQTFTKKLTRGEIEYLDWLERKNRVAVTATDTQGAWTRSGRRGRRLRHEIPAQKANADERT